MLLSLGCQTMREGVIATIIFFIAGVLVILVGASSYVPEFWHLKHIVLLSGFILLLLAPIILVSTFLLSVLPKAKERMDKCEH